MGVHVYNLSDLTKLTQGYLDESSSGNNSHFGNLIPLWINTALGNMVGKEGLEGYATWQTVPNQRAYPLPADFITPKQMLYNGSNCTQVALSLQDFFSSGSAYVDRFTIWNNQLILGVLPPSANYKLEIYYFREPSYLSNGSDIPEIPNRYTPFLACWAAAQAFIVDGDTATAQALMAQYDRQVDNYRQWARYKNRTGFPTVQRTVDF